MKKVIRGRLYDTETAKELGSRFGGSEYNNDFEHFSEVLYRKRTGEYFLYGHGGPKSPYAEHRGKNIGWGEKIVPLTPDAAAKWAEEHLDPEVLKQEFGAPAEDMTRRTINVSLSVNAIETIKKYAAAHDTSVSAVIERLIKEELKMKEFRIKELETAVTYDDVYDTVEEALETIEVYVKDDNDPREPRDEQVTYAVINEAGEIVETVN